ncbi:bifunctional DNA primase/polymerase [Bradyrhizobium sp. BRP56]|uniref:bifunctional DNA primase/polymerase n=1 Tax=Bradyrhizobium sp. BRP56 TaxID=2793819 RepID=UPI001CD4F177|nr:bifunctional DNA primase/polymerase [Bradyrhizobium sp. BRP56]MCA1398658.1 bifunctional DNA primase/polymerase [Bradyrhizobium sp. BRP56]
MQMNAPVSGLADPLLTAALDYARRGFPVFPCNPHTKAPLPKKDVDPDTGEEIPNTGGLRKATTDPRQIQEWWTAWPNAMIGVAAGQRAGFWAIDPDAPKAPGDPDGRQELAHLQIKHGKLPPTHSHLTPGGGKHILFRWRANRPIGNREGALKKKGINVRGEGGYLIFPPSKASNGKAYEIEEALDCFSFAEAPDWLYEMILAKPEGPKISELAMAKVRAPERQRISSGSHREAYAEAALRGEIDKLRGELRGSRNVELNNSAVSLATLVASGDLDEQRVVNELLAACASNGLMQDDGYASCIATIKSGFSYGLQHPRQIEDRREYLHPPRMDHAGAQESGRYSDGAAQVARKITATPYVRVDPATIEPRDWLYGTLLIRKFVTATVAPGGVGKSSLVTAETLSMVSAKGLLGIAPKRRLKSWLWNLEDPLIETQRKIEAAALHYGLKPSETDGYLFVNSGRDTPLVIAKATRNGAFIVVPVVDNLVEECVANGIDVLTVDPFVSSHEVPENDNTSQDMIVKEWGRVADRANIAVHLVDHTHKMRGVEVTTDAARGAKAKTDACRVVRTVNRMTEEEAAKAGVDNYRVYFRTYNDKANLAPPVENSDWFKLESVDLGNAPSGLQYGDSVGVVVPWQWPDHMEGVTGSLVDQVFDKIKSGKWRQDSQSPQWVGHAVAQVMGLDLEKNSHRAQVVSLLKTWKAAGSIVVVDGKDDKRVTRKFVEVAEEQQ